VDICILVDYWEKEEPLYDVGSTPFGDGILDVQDLVVLTEYIEPIDRILIAHWALDETDGTVAYDSTGVNDAFVIGGTVWQSSGGQVDGALELNGLDGCAAAGPVLNPGDPEISSGFSVFAWINGGLPGQVIVSQQGAADWLKVDAQGNLMAELMSTGRSASPLLSQRIINDPPQADWHRVGFVWDGLNRSLYVDDNLVAEDTQDGLESSNGGLYIGTGKLMATGTYWSGLIDDIRIYSRAVTP
jgi:hypothetical protein